MVTSLHIWTFIQLCVLQIKTFGDTHPFTKLVVDLANVDPDIAYSSVPYEKGFALLFYLEQLLGGPGKSLAFSEIIFWGVTWRTRKNFEMFLLHFILPVPSVCSCWRNLYHFLMLPLYLKPWVTKFKIVLLDLKKHTHQLISILQIRKIIHIHWKKCVWYRSV